METELDEEEQEDGVAKQGGTAANAGAPSTGDTFSSGAEKCRTSLTKRRRSHKSSDKAALAAPDEAKKETVQSNSLSPRSSPPRAKAEANLSNQPRPAQHHSRSATEHESPSRDNTVASLESAAALDFIDACSSRVEQHWRELARLQER